MGSRALALIAVSCLIAAACGGTAAPSPTATQSAAASSTASASATATAAPTPAPPSITIFSPQGGIVATNINAPFVVYVRVSGFKMDGSKLGAAPSERLGLWHLFIDDKLAGMSVTESLTVPNATMSDVATGEHTLKVTLNNTDHSPVANAAASSQKINVLAALKYTAGSGSPGIKITSPATGVTRGSANDKRLDIQVTVSGVKLDMGQVGKAPASGVGNWQVLVDGKFAGLSASGIVTLPNDMWPELATGDHEIKAELHNNDQTVMSGAASSTIKVTIKEAMKYP